MKKAIRYIRFSHKGQSNSSIERQEISTDYWLERNQVQLIDSFVDDGYSARTFDRPDFKKLQEFIQKHHRHVDYLLVDQLDRFSRDAADALSMVKRLQKRYSIQIVSATEGITFDYNTPGSFFRAGLQFLLAEEDNINRAQKINAGIYAAKAKEGRWIQGGPAPYGFRKEGTGKERCLVINEDQAIIVRYIYEAFIRSTPKYIIRQEVIQMGFPKTGTNAIDEILENPIYMGYQNVKAWKDLPGGLYKAKHQAIIEPAIWYQVQDKLKKQYNKKNITNDSLFLRGVLNCHCSKLLTGAASRSGSGKNIYYYKCQVAGHNNINANKAHKQLNEVLGYMSLPERIAVRLREKCESEAYQALDENKKLLVAKKRQLSEAEEKLINLEEKWIANQISFETYDRWYNDFINQRINLRSQIEKLQQDETNVFLLLRKEMDKLTDLQAVFGYCDTVAKQELLRMLFDNRLYYRDKTYRTGWIMPVFAHNSLILKQKKLLIIEEINENLVTWR